MSTHMKTTFFQKGALLVVLLIYISKDHGHVDAWNWLLVGNWSSNNFTLPCNTTYSCINLPWGNATYPLSTFRCQGVTQENEQWEYNNQTKALTMTITSTSPTTSQTFCLDATQNSSGVVLHKCNESLSQQWHFNQSKIYNGLGLYLYVLKWEPSDSQWFDLSPTEQLEADAQLNNDSRVTDFTFMPSSAVVNVPSFQPTENTSNLVSNGRFEYLWEYLFVQSVGDLTYICYWAALADNDICTLTTNNTSTHYLQLASISQRVYTYAGLEHLLTFQTRVQSDSSCSQQCDQTQPVYISVSVQPSSLPPTVVQVDMKSDKWDIHFIKFFANSSSANLTFTTSSGYNGCKPSLTDVQLTLLPSNFDKNVQLVQFRRGRISWLDVGLILGNASSWVIILMIVFVFFICKRHKKRIKFVDVEDLNIQPKDMILARKFDVSDIFLLTDGFKDIHCIGQGGFAKVYRGKTLDGTDVAIKRVKPLQPFPRFYEEVDMLSKVHHRRLVEFLGYCNANGNEQILVFELMTNGSLHEHIHNPEMTPLSIDQRFKIAQDVAQGLEYLHHGVKPPIIHRDVKSSNVLLTKSFSAKLTDFGIFKVVHDNTTDLKTVSTSTVVRGSYGYMDPQNFHTGTISTKSDVYAFGVLLLELISGRKAIHEEACLSEWGMDLLENNEHWLHHMIDPSIEMEFNSFEVSQLEIMGKVAQRCLQDQREKRPNMFEVMRMLGGPWSA